MLIGIEHFQRHRPLDKLDEPLRVPRHLPVRQHAVAPERQVHSSPGVQVVAAADLQTTVEVFVEKSPQKDVGQSALCAEKTNNKSDATVFMDEKDEEEG